MNYLFMLYLMKKRKENKQIESGDFQFDGKINRKLIQDYFKLEEVNFLRLTFKDDLFYWYNANLMTSQISDSIWLRESLKTHLIELSEKFESDIQLSIEETFCPKQCKEEREMGHKRAFENWSGFESAIVKDLAGDLYECIGDHADFERYGFFDNLHQDFHEDHFKLIKKYRWMVYEELNFWTVHIMSKLILRHPHAIIYRLNWEGPLERDYHVQAKDMTDVMKSIALYDLIEKEVKEKCK